MENNMKLHLSLIEKWFTMTAPDGLQRILDKNN